MGGSVVPICLAALYLRGGPRSVTPSRSGWPFVDAALRRHPSSLAEASEALRSEGLWSEALCLEQPGLLSWAEQQYEAGRVLSAACEEYPPRWRRCLKGSTPPALWRVGDWLESPFLSVVGSRDVTAPVRRFAEGVGRVAVELGFTVASGGAMGCDRAAARGAGSRVVEILPYGITRYSGGVAALSVCAPDEEFSRGAAMERNQLIYALSDWTVVAHSRFREGGTWTGATHAIRRRLSTLLVRFDDLSPAHRALVALGGRWLRSDSDLPSTLAEPDRQMQFAI